MSDTQAWLLLLAAIAGIIIALDEMARYRHQRDLERNRRRQAELGEDEEAVSDLEGNRS